MQEMNWYGLNMVPSWLETSEKALGASKTSMAWLKSVEQGLESPDEKRTIAIIEDHCSQNSKHLMLLEQCKRWRNSNPGMQQLHWVAHIENTVALIDYLNQQIFSLIKSLHGAEILSILSKCDNRKGFKYFLKDISSIQYH